jgi:hypothetical protein
MNFAGSIWFTENRNDRIQISSDGGYDLRRMEHYLNGIIQGGHNIKSDSLITPTHFGYKENESLYQVFNSTPTYIISTEIGIKSVYAFPEIVQSLIASWNKEDFDTLKKDPYVDLIYSNNEFKVWSLNG